MECQEIGEQVALCLESDVRLFGLVYLMYHLTVGTNIEQMNFPLRQFYNLISPRRMLIVCSLQSCLEV